MLTIKAPIELHSTDFHVGDGGGFAERLMGTYALMGSGVTDQTLTHLLHTPPEILIAPSGDTDIRNRTDIYAFREEQQTIITNVVNRILLSNSYSLTYQDRVFITDTLHKLGIRDDRRFMNEVRQLLSETDNSRELTELYLTHVDELHEMLEYLNSIEEREEVPVPEGGEREHYTNRLYMEIMERLKTGAVYQIVNNMNRSVTSYGPGSSEIRISEQSYLARQILLSRFRNIAAGQPETLIYRSENRYEEATREEETVSEKTIREQLTSAVFLEVLRSFEHALSIRDEAGTPKWMDLRNSYYQTADNALSRILIEAREHRSAVIREETELTYLNESEERELQILRELFEEGAYYYAQYDSLREAYESEAYRETVRERETFGEEIQRSRETVIPGETTREFTAATIEHLQSDSSETVLEELERINRQNVENMSLYNRIRTLLTERSERVRMSGSDRERTIRESLKVLADRDHIRKILETENRSELTSDEKLLERVYELLPPESAAIFRQLQEGKEGTPQAAPSATPAEFIEQELTNFVESESVEERPAAASERPASREEREEPSYRSEIREEEISDAVGRILSDETAGGLYRSFREFLSVEMIGREREIFDTEHILRFVELPAEAEEIMLRLAGDLAPGTPPGTVRQRRSGGSPEVSFVHRQEERLTEEDVLETLEEYRKGLTTTTKVTEEPARITEVRTAAPEIVREERRTMSREESEDIARLVEQGVRQQLNTIAGEVYSRLEKRLKTEKSRRGI
ncbi:MAG: hypothetical protein K6F53_12435 [Lachnospiraceae bacterium]|nr:hypothetical protein [Lachnospiraceae bacterium]